MNKDIHNVLMTLIVVSVLVINCCLIVDPLMIKRRYRILNIVTLTLLVLIALPYYLILK